MTIVPPRYLGVRPLGTGSFAAVYAAEDSLLGRAVAIKVLREEHLADPSAQARFAREVQVGARLGAHPFIVTLHDAGEWAGRPYLVMELLESSVAERRNASERLALRWLAQAADALDFAHVHGIVHRDVKPSNLLLDTRGDARLADFGVARDAEATGLTLAGHVVGTPGYLAPEVAAGETATPAADIYSLAVVARELLGDRPALDAALARDPNDRPPSAALFVAELGGGDARTQVLPTRSTRIAPIPVTQVARPARPARRHRTVRVGFVATLIAALAVGSAAGAAFMAGRLPLPLLHAATDETCAVSPMNHDANVVVRGSDANTFCRSQASVLQLDGDSWTYRSGGDLIAPDHGKSKLAVVCRLHRSRLNATVYDSGSQQIGGDVCSLFASSGWQT